MSISDVSRRTIFNSQTQEHHLVMSTLQVVCNYCQQAGRGPGEHPGGSGGGSGGGSQIRYVVANYGTA